MLDKPFLMLNTFIMKHRSETKDCINYRTKYLDSPTISDPNKLKSKRIRTDRIDLGHTGYKNNEQWLLDRYIHLHIHRFCLPPFPEYLEDFNYNQINSQNYLPKARINFFLRFSLFLFPLDNHQDFVTKTPPQRLRQWQENSKKRFLTKRVA